MLSGRTGDHGDSSLSRSGDAGDNTSTLSRSGWTVVRVGSDSNNTLTAGDEDVRVQTGADGDGDVTGEKQ